MDETAPTKPERVVLERIPPENRSRYALLPQWSRIYVFIIFVSVPLGLWLAPKWMAFWGRCIGLGWSLGNSFVGYLQGFLTIVIAAILLRRSVKHEVPWEGVAVKLLAVVLLASFAVCTIFIAPFLEYERVKQQTTADASAEWPALTPVQIEKWVAELTPVKPPIMVIQLSGQSTEKLGKSIFEIGKRLHWQFQMEAVYSERSGITIDSPKTQFAEALLRLFTDSNCAARITPDHGSDDFMYLRIGEPP